jgi:hypothetical protein
MSTVLREYRALASFHLLRFSEFITAPHAGLCLCCSFVFDFTISSSFPSVVEIPAGKEAEVDNLLKPLEQLRAISTSKETISKVSKLDSSQILAIKKVFSRQGIHLIQGPPGSGPLL